MKIFEWEAHHNVHETTVADGYVLAENAEKAKEKIKSIHISRPNIAIELVNEYGVELSNDIGLRWIDFD